MVLIVMGRVLERAIPISCALPATRAHTSGWDSMTRSNMKSQFVVYNGLYPGVDNRSPIEFAQGRTSAEIQRIFYGRSSNSFASYQISLCNKCHAKD
jgi:hypothetical protein